MSGASSDFSSPRGDHIASAGKRGSSSTAASTEVALDQAVITQELQSHTCSLFHPAWLANLFMSDPDTWVTDRCGTEPHGVRRAVAPCMNGSPKWPLRAPGRQFSTGEAALAFAPAWQGGGECEGCGASLDSTLRASLRAECSRSRGWGLLCWIRSNAQEASCTNRT